MSGCDISAPSGMKFQKVAAMYCNYRKYKPGDYVFAVDGVLLEDDKTLAQQGLTEATKTYVVNVYNAAKVNISE